MHKNLIVISDTHTRFEGTSIGTSVGLSVGPSKFKTINTFYTNVDPSSLADAFLKINSIGNAYVFLALCADVVHKKIKVASYLDEVVNLCRNIKSIGCTPVVCLNFYEIENPLKKRKARHLEKGLVKQCTDNDIDFMRVNLISKNDYFFNQIGKDNLIMKICDFCSKRKKSDNGMIVGDEISVKNIQNTNKTIVMKKARRVIV